MIEATQNQRLRSTFTLEVDYRASSREDLFLSSGWGMRDVGGPYVMASSALVTLPNWTLSAEHVSMITLVLALSNRSPVDALLISIVSNCGSKTYLLPRNEAIDVLNGPVILKDPKDEFGIFINVSWKPNIAQFYDLVRIDKLRVERNSSY